MKLEDVRRALFLVGHIVELHDKLEAFEHSKILSIGTCYRGRNFDFQIEDQPMTQTIIEILKVHIESSKAELQELAGEELLADLMADGGPHPVDPVNGAAERARQMALQQVAVLAGADGGPKSESCRRRRGADLGALPPGALRCNRSTAG